MKKREKMRKKENKMHQKQIKLVGLLNIIAIYTRRERDNQEPTQHQPPAPNTSTSTSKPAPSQKNGRQPRQGYSYTNSGLSTHTATGINLLKNPMVIAVDSPCHSIRYKTWSSGYGLLLQEILAEQWKAIKSIFIPTSWQAYHGEGKTITIKILLN